MLPLSSTIEFGTLTRTLLGGQYIESWIYHGGDFSTGVYTADLSTLREENPARDLTSVSAVIVVLGPVHTVGGVQRRPIARNDQARLLVNGARESFRIVGIDSAPGGIGTRMLLELV